MKLFLSPHNDDETLFAAFTLLRERPLVVVVTDSYVQFNRGDGITAEQRWRETRAAMSILQCSVMRLGLRDDALSEAVVEDSLRRFEGFDVVYAPAIQGGNLQHDIIARVARRLFKNVVEYCTYTKDSPFANIGSCEVIGTFEERRLKHRALQEYRSQHQRSRLHFEAVEGKSEWLTPIGDLTPATVQRRLRSDVLSTTAAGLRVAYVVESYPTFIVSEIEQLRQLGARVVLLSAFRPVPQTDPVKDAARSESIYLPPTMTDLLLANLQAVWRRPLVYASLALKLRREHESLRLLLLAAYHAQIVERDRINHLHGTFGTRTATLAFLISRLTGVPFSFTTHAYDVFRPNATLVWKTNSSAFMRTISRFNKDFIERTYKGIDGSRIEVVRLGVDLDQLRYRPRPRRDGPIRILTIANLLEQKGLLILVRACEHLVRQGLRFECRIAGDGPLRARLEQEISACHVDGYVRLLGAQPHADAIGELEQADVFVLACIDMRDRGEHMDGIPVALMEALAAGVPSISTDVSGIPELIEGGVSGLLVAPDDSVALANAIQRLADDVDLRESIAVAGRRSVTEHFDLAQNTAALAQTMRAVAVIRESA